MLLRSITQHVKDQNWFAIFLDFFIVVVGVFIGIQVSNWNDARTEREQERTILAALKSDVVQSARDLTSLLELAESGSEHLRRLAEFVDGQHDDLGSREIDADIFYGLYSLNYFTPTNGTYNELVNSGRLGLINDTELRAKLQDLAGEIDFLKNEEAGIERMAYLTSDPILISKTDFRGFVSLPSPRKGAYLVEWVDPQKDRRDYKISLRTSAFLNVVLYRARLDLSFLNIAMRVGDLLEQAGQLIDRRIAELDG